MPYLGSTLFVSTVVVAALLGSIGYWLLVRALAPGFHDRAEGAWARHPALSVLLGAVLSTAGFLVCAVAMSASAGILKALGLLAAATLVGVGLAGSAGLATRIGRGLASALDEHAPWRRTLRGAIVLCVSLLTPLVGWFVIQPIMLVGGLGAAASAISGAALSRVSRLLASPARAAGGGDSL